MAWFHDPWSELTTFTPVPMNAPLEDIDYQIALFRNMMVKGYFEYDEFTGILSWPEGFMIIYTGPDGVLSAEWADAGQIELTPLVDGCLVGVDLTLVTDTDLSDEVYIIPDPWSEEESPLARVWTGVVFGYADEDGFCPGPMIRDWAVVSSGS